eukprot:COSAG02_NODE_534_length_20663_cov_20.040945_7_plen_155_part_00
MSEHVTIAWRVLQSLTTIVTRRSNYVNCTIDVVFHCSVKDQLGLDVRLGESLTHYKCEAAMTEPDSLYALYVNKAVPTVLFTSPSQPQYRRQQHEGREELNSSVVGLARPQWFVFGTGALTYDIYVSDFINPSFRLTNIRRHARARKRSFSSHC